MKYVKLIGTCVVSTCWLGLATNALADSGKAVGHTTFVVKSSESLSLDDGTTAQRSSWAGLAVAPNNLMDNTNWICSGTVIISSEGEALKGAGYCDIIEVNGDTAWVWWRGSTSDGVWGFLGGTGDYEGIEGDGTYATPAAWADGSFINSWEISWKR